MKKIVFPNVMLVLLTLLVGCGSGGDDPITVMPPTQDQSFEDYIISQEFSGAVMIAQDGNILLNRGFGNANNSTSASNNSNTIFRLASVSKQFTAMAIMILQEDGILSIDDTVSIHLSDYPNGDNITIKNLLTHTAGIPNYTSLANFSELQLIHHTPEQLVAIFKDLPLEFTPSSQYSYSNSGYALLGLIIERASGISYADYVRQEIFEPLDMQQSGYGESSTGNNIAIGYSSSGNEAETLDMSVPYAAGALVSTVNDLYKWDQSFYQNSLVNEESKETIFTAFFNGYGLGWSIGNLIGTGEYNYSHTGGINGFSTIILRFPDTRKLIVILSNVEGFPTDQIAIHLNTMITQ
jgi:CubicO group peptidase (beta-lactamase class C family)